MILRVILALDNPSFQKKLQEMLDEPDVLVESITGKNHFWQQIGREGGDVAIVSESFLKRAVSQRIKLLQALPESPWIVAVSDREDVKQWAKYQAAGCEAVIYENLPDERLHDTLRQILEKRQEFSEQEVAVKRAFLQPRLSDFVSRSPAMQTFMNVVARVTKSDVSLLILGETGVGKERLARAIHAESQRSESPFIAVNCGALPETLLESELFGHEEGAFTGATRSRRGWFELSHRGTIFLDEIGELPPHLQVKLLRVLQDHEIQRVGSEKSFPVNVRVMAATNHDLDEDVEEKRFRRDLYYRLNVVSLTLPPLRERREDIQMLVKSYINHFTTIMPCTARGITGEALKTLVDYSWPGNVRELMNVIERAVLLCGSDSIDLDDLPQPIRTGSSTKRMSSQARPLWDSHQDMPEEMIRKPLANARREVLEDFERAYLSKLLKMTGGRVGETAKRAGILPRSLYDKMKQYGLRKEDFKYR